MQVMPPGATGGPSRLFILRPVATTLLMVAILLAGIIGGGGHHIRAGARIEGNDLNGGVIHFRQRRDGQEAIANNPGEQDRHHQRIIGYRFLPVSALPEVDYPPIQVVTLYPGASPDVVTSAITAPLERQFGQMSGLKQMSSQSSGGASVVTRVTTDAPPELCDDICFRPDI